MLRIERPGASARPARATAAPTAPHAAAGSLRHLLVIDVARAPQAAPLERTRVELASWLRAEMRVGDDQIRLAVDDLHAVEAGTAAGEPVVLHALAQEVGRVSHPLVVTFGGHRRGLLPLVRLRAMAHGIAMPQLYPAADRGAYFTTRNPHWHLDLEEALGVALDELSLEGVCRTVGFAIPPAPRPAFVEAQLRAVALYGVLLSYLRHVDRLSAAGLRLAADDLSEFLETRGAQQAAFSALGDQIRRVFAPRPPLG